MSLLFRLLSLFSPGLNFIWIKKTMWTGAESEMSCSLFSTSSEVLGEGFRPKLETYRYRI